MSLRHALLGLLREGPASGYDLLQEFKLSLHNVWPATQSQLYTELGKLADEGLLTVTPNGARGRKEYALTDAGLHPRSEGLLRVFLLGALTRDQARAYLGWLAERSAETSPGCGPSMPPRTGPTRTCTSTAGWSSSTASACPR
jgi:PadR family transcriptional regulator AphA